MTGDAKINLSAEELQLMCNSNWILTKRIVFDKMSQLLGSMVPALQEVAAGQPGLPAEALVANAKIHKGENYLGLPYLLLDCPAFFSKEGVFALRTFFWWGRFFSVTLHVSGRYKAMFAGNLLHKAGALHQSGLSVCINTNEWQHHFEADNYVPAASQSLQQLHTIITTAAFVKLAVSFNLAQWNELPVLVNHAAKKMLKLITA
jgi:hypothetical protein